MAVMVCSLGKVWCAELQVSAGLVIPASTVTHSFVISQQVEIKHRKHTYMHVSLHQSRCNIFVQIKWTFSRHWHPKGKISKMCTQQMHVQLCIVQRRLGELLCTGWSTCVLAHLCACVPTWPPCNKGKTLLWGHTRHLTWGEPVAASRHPPPPQAGEINSSGSLTIINPSLCSLVFACLSNAGWGNLGHRQVGETSDQLLHNGAYFVHLEEER